MSSIPLSTLLGFGFGAVPDFASENGRSIPKYKASEGTSVTTNVSGYSGKNG